MGETMSEALCPVLGSPVATLRILQLVYWSVKGLPHPDVHLFITQPRRVRLHFGSSGSLTNGFVPKKKMVKMIFAVKR